MSFRIELVKGLECAGEASQILRDSWRAPALHYTPEYVAWQLSFPSPVPLPCAMAFDGDTPVAFAGMTARRLRVGNEVFDSGVVSFVAVRPDWRGKGLAAAIYDNLCGAIEALDIPFLTFGAPDSPGLKVLLAAYARAGFGEHSLGAFPSCAAMVKTGAAATGDWKARVVNFETGPVDIRDALSRDASIVASDPSDAQLRHYALDPRRRALVLLENSVSKARGIAWLVEVEYLTATGPEAAPVVDHVQIPEFDASALPVLFHLAAEWSHSQRPALISAPSLAGFSAEELRRAGIRRTGKGFSGYCFAPRMPAFMEPVRTANIEVI